MDFRGGDDRAPSPTILNSFENTPPPQYKLEGAMDTEEQQPVSQGAVGPVQDKGAPHIDGSSPPTKGLLRLTSPAPKVQIDRLEGKRVKRYQLTGYMQI